MITTPIHKVKEIPVAVSDPNKSTNTVVNPERISIGPIQTNTIWNNWLTPIKASSKLPKAVRTVIRHRIRVKRAKINTAAGVGVAMSSS